MYRYDYITYEILFTKYQIDNLFANKVYNSTAEILKYAKNKNIMYALEIITTITLF